MVSWILILNLICLADWPILFLALLAMLSVCTDFGPRSELKSAAQLLSVLSRSIQISSEDRIEPWS